jgi:hypothetical protein
MRMITLKDSSFIFWWPLHEEISSFLQLLKKEKTNMAHSCRALYYGRSLIHSFSQTWTRTTKILILVIFIKIPIEQNTFRPLLKGYTQICYLVIVTFRQSSSLKKLSKIFGCSFWSDLYFKPLSLLIAKTNITDFQAPPIDASAYTFVHMLFCYYNFIVYDHMK